LLTDLFSTLIPGGDVERDVMNARMGVALGVDPAAFQAAFDASSYERFIGAYGDLPNTLRVIAERCGGTPTDEQVHEATSLRRALARRLLSAAPAATLDTLKGFKAAGWRTTNWAAPRPSACTRSVRRNTQTATLPGPDRRSTPSPTCRRTWSDRQ
jgi:putative hydrolase of the HAD superfamily